MTQSEQDRLPSLGARSAQPWQNRELHFVGVGGCGMSGLALIAQQFGAKVTGSDQKQSIFIDSLQSAGNDIALEIGHKSSNVPETAELVYSSAVKPDNEERAFARGRGQSEMHRSQLIAQLTQERRTIAVAGAHGKTTTSALLAHILTSAGKDPSYIIGGLLRPPALHARGGASDLLVIEADESDRSLLNYEVDIALITNIDLDHVGDAGGYHDRSDMVGLFRTFAKDAKTLICPPVVAEEMGLDQASPGLTVIAPEPEARKGSFVLNDHIHPITLPGEHNVTNASLAVAAASMLGCSNEEIDTALATFPGLKRRFEYRGTTPSGAKVFDDYAHHPAEVAAAISTGRSVADGRVYAVFQPHLFSRTRQFAAQFAEALAGADVAALDSIYPARETQSDFPDVTSELISASAALTEPIIYPVDDRSLVKTVCGWDLAAGDVVLLLGAGDVGRLASALVSCPDDV